MDWDQVLCHRPLLSPHHGVGGLHGLGHPLRTLLMNAPL